MSTHWEFGQPEGIHTFAEFGHPASVPPPEDVSDTPSDRATVPPGYGERFECAPDPDEQVAAHLGPLAAEAVDATEPRDTRNLGHPLWEPPVLISTPDQDPRPTQALDISHTDTHTVVTDPSHPQPELCEEVADQLIFGIPDEWSPIEADGGSTEFRVDDADNPSYFLKSWQTGDQNLAVEEMRLAPTIDRLISNEGVQQFVQQYRFAGIEYVRPLASGTDHEQGQEYIVYPRINGTSPQPWIGPPGQKKFDLDAAQVRRDLKDIAKGLRSYMKANGIGPVDLTAEHMLVSTDDEGTRRIHIVDATDYRDDRALPQTRDDGSLDYTPDVPPDISTTQEIPPIDEYLAPELEPSDEDVPSGVLALPFRPLDVRRTATESVIASTSHANPEQVEQVAADITDGIPPTYRPFRPPDGTSPAYYVDSEASPSVFIKVRGDATNLGEMHQNAQRIDGIMRERIKDGEFLSGVEIIRGRVSILQEMQLAPHIQDALRDDALQAFVQSFTDETGQQRYASIEYVAPLAARVDATTGEKFIAYPYVDGYAPYAHRDNHPATTFEQYFNEAQAVSDIAERVTTHLRARGIRTMDFSDANFIVTTDDAGQRHLHVVDAAHFIPFRPTKEDTGA